MIFPFSARRPSLLRSLATLGMLVAVALPAAGLGARSAGAAAICSLVASPTGSDSASGAVATPFRTAKHLIDVLSAGQTGCLRAGTYSESLKFSHGGASGAPLTLTSYPGERATVVGRMWVASGSDYVTVSGLSLDGRNATNLPSPMINGSHVTFSGNDVTNQHTTICFNLGEAGWGRATSVTLERNRIHGCGRLPSTNKDHGIYNDQTTDVTIAWNLIYDNTDRGIQLYPDAQQGSIVHNVIDGNGEGILFSGDFGNASSNQDVAYNVISNAKIRNNAESWYPTGNPIGRNNIVHNNCLWGGAQGSIDTSDGGFAAQNNTTADPQFANRGAGDFRMASTSPCAAIAGDVQGAVNGVAPSPVLTHITAAPGAATLIVGRLLGGTVADLATADKTSYQVASSSGATRTSTFNASFTGVPATLSGLRLTYQGGATASCTQTVSLYRFSTGVWTVLDSRTASVADQALSSLVPPGSPSEYVSSTGEIRSRVGCSATQTGFTLNGNQLQLAYDRP